ncbi:MAG: DNA topoisomerase, partial [Gemmatimonadota bacterium]|nr:DNA topoisomerase [Gemmatimonadota bacterium]
MVTRKKTAKPKAKPKPAATRARQPVASAPKPATRPSATSPAKAPAKAPGKPRGRRPDGDGASPPSGSLVVVESPTKAKSIGKYLGRGFDVRATVGHIRDLPTRKLGVDVDNGFQPEYVTIKGKAQTLADLKKAASKATAIYLATDPDREGEAIAWHVADQIDTTAPVHRVLFHEITKDAVKEAMARPQQIDARLVEAQQARRILDRLVGYKASPILWHSIKTGLSAGRVQTVALRMIVEREREIRAFNPAEYWSIAADCFSHGQEFSVELKKIDGHNPHLTNEADAQAVVRDLRAMSFVVTKVEKRHRKKRPGAPFTTSTIQQEAAKKL